MPYTYSQKPFGSFDVRYRAEAEEVDIRVKINWDFDPLFSPQEIINFKTTAIQNIKLTWDRSGSFLCLSGPNKGKRAVPVFQIVDEQNARNAHFRFVVGKGNGMGGLIPNRQTVNLFEYDAETKQSLVDSAVPAKQAVGRNAMQNRMGLSVRARREMEKAVTDARRNILLERNPRNSSDWSVSNRSQRDLRDLATHLRTRWPARLSRPALIIQTVSGRERKADDMANTVRDYLLTQNLPVGQIVRTQTTTTKPKFKWPWKGPKPMGTAILTYEDEISLLQRDGLSNEYCVAAHEFGHCLGLPDEYCDSSPECKILWEKQIRDADIGPPPERKQGATKYTGCIMHAGIVVEKRHMVTIRTALQYHSIAKWAIR